jgi:hypothetical protein
MIQEGPALGQFTPKPAVPAAAFTIATIPALTADGSPIQAFTTAAKSGDSRSKSAT